MRHIDISSTLAVPPQQAVLYYCTREAVHRKPDSNSRRVLLGGQGATAYYVVLMRVAPLRPHQRVSSHT